MKKFDTNKEFPIRVIYFIPLIGIAFFSKDAADYESQQTASQYFNRPNVFGNDTILMGLLIVWNAAMIGLSFFLVMGYLNG